MVAALDPADGMKPFPGLTKESCRFMGVDGLRLPLAWHAGRAPAAGTPVALRVYYRDATVYAIGTGETGSAHARV